MQVSAYPQEAVAEVYKAVSDPTRVRILALIQKAGELCVCHVEAALHLGQSRASRHLSALRRAGLLVSWREGAFIHYRAVAAEEADVVQRGILETFERQFEGDESLAEDVRRALACRASGDCGPEEKSKS